jgi:hypothetical protein
MKYEQNPKRVANCNCRDSVESRTPFEGSNMYANWQAYSVNTESEYSSNYVVYSYGSHFPMYVYCEVTDQWFGNNGRYSRTTSRHQTQARPHNTNGKPIIWLTTEQLIDITNHGFVGFTCKQLGEPA